MKHLGRTLGSAFLSSLEIKLLVCTVLIVYCMCVSVWVYKLTCRPSGRSLSPLWALRWSAARRSWPGQRSRTAGGTERVEDLSYCRSAAYDLRQEVCQDCYDSGFQDYSLLCERQQSYLFLWPGRWCTDLSSCLCCSGPAEVKRKRKVQKAHSKVQHLCSDLAGGSSGFQDSELMIRSVTTFPVILKCVASFCKWVHFEKSLVPETQ